MVTANKRAQLLSDVPMSITAATGDQLLDKGVTSAADLIRIVPGLSYVEAGGSIPVYSLRGVGYYDTSAAARPSVSVYLDEAPLPFSIMSQGASFDVQRVEVLKGPQGTLFGANATGGSINYISNKPTDTWKGGADVSYGRFNSLDAQAAIGGPLAEGVGLRVAVRSLTADPWQKSYTRDDKLGRKNLQQGRVMLTLKPTERLSVALTANGLIDKSDTQAGQFQGARYRNPTQGAAVAPLTAAYPLSPNNSRAADWNPGRDYARDNYFYQLIGRIDYELSDNITLTSLSAYSRYRVRQLSDQDGTALSSYAVFNNAKLRSFSQELRVTATLGAATVIVGGNYSNDRGNEDNVADFAYSTTAANAGRTTARLVTQQNFINKGVFANVDLELSDKLVAHAGARYSDSKDKYFGCQGDINLNFRNTPSFNALNARRVAAGLAPILLTPNQCISVLPDNLNFGADSGTLHQKPFAWRGGLDYKFSPGNLVYANVSRGFKEGNTTTIFAGSAGQYSPVVQEQLTAYELGFKSRVIDRLLQATGAVFYYDYKDKQIRGRIPVLPINLSPAEALINVPKSRIKGAEIQLMLTPMQGLTLNTGITYINSKVKGTFINQSLLGVQQDFGGSPFPYTPKWQGVGDVEYKFAISPDVNAFMGAGVTYRSSTYAGLGTELPIDAYTLYDLRAGVNLTNGVTVQVYGNNVTNKYYWTNVARVGDSVRRLAGMAATYGVRVAYRF